MDRIFEYELLHFCKSIEGRIYIFGAGECAKRLIPVLNSKSIVISASIVSCLDDKENAINDIPIICISDFSAASNDGIIIALANDNPDIMSVRETLVKCGIDPGSIYLQRLFFRALGIKDISISLYYSPNNLVAT